jgi:hypothetical protein
LRFSGVEGAAQATWARQKKHDPDNAPPPIRIIKIQRLPSYHPKQGNPLSGSAVYFEPHEHLHDA